jgi:probable selenium-dependent hydroxylase accessory protein YqeC
VAPLIELGDISTGLDLGSRSHLALVGGGGKTTVMHALGRTLPGRIVLTTTVKMGADQHGGHRVLLDPAPADVVAAASKAPVVVWSRIDGQKAIGVDPVTCDAFFAARLDHLTADHPTADHLTADHVIVEADGSRRRPFKAPAHFEPVVPSTTTVVASLIGIDAIGKVIADRCHRPMRVAALAGVRPYDRLTIQGAAAVLTHERGQRRSVPPGARYVVVVTKVGAATRSAFADLADRVEAAGADVIGIGQVDESALSAFR